MQGRHQLLLWMLCAAGLVSCLPAFARAEPESGPYPPRRTQTAVDITGAGPQAGFERFRNERTVLRLRGDFGEAIGRVVSVDSAGTWKMLTDPTFDSSPSLPSPIQWDQVSQVDKQAGSSGRFAVVGALVVAAATGALAAKIASSNAGFTYAEDEEVVAGGIAGAMVGAAAGATLGALLGRNVLRWHRVYRAPDPPRLPDSTR